MISMPAGTRIWVACGATDMRKGFDGLAMLAQDVVKQSAYCGHIFVFRGKRADRIRLVSVAKLVDFERGQVSYADFIGITVLPCG